MENRGRGQRHLVTTLGALRHLRTGDLANGTQ